MPKTLPDVPPALAALSLAALLLSLGIGIEEQDTPRIREAQRELSLRGVHVRIRRARAVASPEGVAA